VLQASGLSTNGVCPLCDGPAYLQESLQKLGVAWVICDRCGYFLIEDGALNGFQQERHLVAGMTRRSSGSQPSVESRLTLTRNNIRDVCALPFNLRLAKPSKG